MVEKWQEIKARTEAKRQEIIERAVVVVDRIILIGSDGSREEINFLTAKVVEKLVNKASISCYTSLQRKDCEEKERKINKKIKRVAKPLQSITADIIDTLGFPERSECLLVCAKHHKGAIINASGKALTEALRGHFEKYSGCNHSHIEIFMTDSDGALVIKEELKKRLPFLVPLPIKQKPKKCPN